MELFEQRSYSKKDTAIKKTKNEIIHYLEQCHSDYLKNMYKYLFKKTTAIRKAEICEVIAEYFTFSDVEQFNKWFFSFSEPVQKILYEIAFTDYMPISYLEKKLNISMGAKKSKYSWERKLIVNIEYQDLFYFAECFNFYDCNVIGAIDFIKNVLKKWLEPPPLSKLSACRLDNQQQEGWNNSVLVSETFSLLCDALHIYIDDIKEKNKNNYSDYYDEEDYEYFNTNSVDKIIRNGFKKKEINELCSSTGYLNFTMNSEYTPVCVDLAARFLLCMSGNKPKRPKDGQECIKNFIKAFFNNESLYQKKRFMPDRTFLEYNICLDYFNRTTGYYYIDNKTPPARKIFYDIITFIANDGNWFDADKLTEYIRINGKVADFCECFPQSNLRIRAEYINIDEITYMPDYRDFIPNGIMQYYLLARPLFKAYCYIFASLGLLEIIQADPPLVKKTGKKEGPVSQYDSLKAVRVTGFGKWCLGLTEERPRQAAEECQAIADRELFLVTVQGKSLERKVFLDRVGQKLGENRWRISPASFISGCASIKQITERIDKFKMLIDSEPAPHWKELFNKVADRAGIFNLARTNMIVYDLPKDKELINELFSDPEFKKIIHRTEGNMFVVAARDNQKLIAILQDHGIAHW